MKKKIIYISILLFSCSPFLLKAQCDPPAQWDIEFAAGEDLRIRDLPDNIVSTTFKNMLGVNANLEWDQIYNNSGCPIDDNPFSPLVNNIRSFHLGEKDYTMKCNSSTNCDGIGCLNFGSFEICPPTLRGTDGPFTGLCQNGGLDKYRFRYDDWNEDEDWAGCTDVPANCSGAPFCASNNLNLSTALLVAPINVPAEDQSQYGQAVADFNDAHKFPVGWWTALEWSANLDPDEIHDNAYAYADAFIQTMCPEGNCMVDMLEIGNEPWNYAWDASMGDYEPIYAAISRGMVKAFKDNFGSDSENWPMQLMPAAFQAKYADPNAPWDNYLGRRIVENLAPSFMGINIHPYSLKIGENNWTYPEDGNSEFHSIAHAVKWRDHNMPCKMIYASEYGWDSYPFPDDPSGLFDGGVGEAAQAVYNLRATLMMARAGVERAVLFNSNDAGLWHADFFRTSGLFKLGPSGACGGGTNPIYEAKQSFLALEEFLAALGHTRHYQVLQETDGVDGVYAYLLGDQDCPTHVVAWRPIEIGLNPDGTNSNTYDAIAATIPLPDQYEFELGPEANWLDGLQNDYTGNIQIQTNNQLKIELVSPTPVLIPIFEANCLQDNCGEITISGRIYTDCDGVEDQVVPGVTLEISGAVPGYDPITTTDENGYYEFTGLCAGRNYTITPSNKEIDQCGLDQNDVETITGHLYCCPSSGDLNTPFKLLAADIDGNQVLELTDANNLELFINGDPSVPDFFGLGGQHWKFVSAAYIFPDPLNPFLTNPSAPHTYNGPLYDQLNQDFIAVKIGDVDCTYVTTCDFVESPCVQIDNGCEDADEDQWGNVNVTNEYLDLGKYLVGLTFNNTGIPPGSTIIDARIKFTSLYSTDVPCHLSIAGEIGGNTSCFSDDDDNLSNRPLTSTEVEWNIIESWGSDDSYNTPNISQVLQEIVNDVSYDLSSPVILMLDKQLNNSTKRSVFSFEGDEDNAPQLCITYNPGFSTGGGRMRGESKGVVISKNNPSATNSIISNVNNYPNPFDDFTQIDFLLHDDANVKIKVYNNLGQVLFQKTNFLVAGNQYFRIDDLSIESGTILFYTIEAREQKIVGKMVYLDPQE